VAQAFVRIRRRIGGGVSVEWIGFRMLKRWEHSESMPVIPIFGVGLVPVLQMVILPPLIFLAGQAVQSKIESRGHDFEPS
jgi:hypothetical protein